MDRKRGAFFQSNFYCSQYRMVLRLFFLLCFLSFALVCTVGWLTIFHKVPQIYYAAVTNGQILPLKPEK